MERKTQPEIDRLRVNGERLWDSLMELAKIGATPKGGVCRLTLTDLDRQGRVVIPAYLRQETGLEEEAVIVGSRDHAEIWAPARWDAYRRALDDPDELARAISGLGI